MLGKSIHEIINGSYSSNQVSQAKRNEAIAFLEWVKANPLKTDGKPSETCYNLFKQETLSSYTGNPLGAAQMSEEERKKYLGCSLRFLPR